MNLYKLTVQGFLFRQEYYRRAESENDAISQLMSEFIGLRRTSILKVELAS